MSIATRIGAMNELAASSIRSRCSVQSTINTGASSGSSEVTRARRVRQARSVVGYASTRSRTPRSQSQSVSGSV